ncbi:uncharacterized protein [Mytilus edulis]|uniref:uncharacterized protein n=1 Tax=Mytilus edulis TaxID=6550 RepID=UPI0039EF30CE
MDDNLDVVVDFFERRNVEKKYIQRLKEEKMDPQTFLAMSDEQLHTYIPAYGDIYAARRYFKDLMKREHKNQRSDSLFKKLRRKMGKEKSSDSEEEGEGDKKGTRKKSKKTDGFQLHSNRSEKLRGNSNAKKAVRQIEIGWFDYEYDDNAYHQVKTPNGGGARHVSAPKSWLPNDIMEHGKKLFFRNGKSKKGMVTEFDFEIRNFMGESIEEDCTVADLYDETGSRQLRYYLYTKKRTTSILEQAIDESQLELEEDEDLPDILYTRNLQRSISMSTLPDTGNPGTSTPLPKPSSSINQIVTLKIASDDEGIIFCPQENDHYQLLQSLNAAVDILPPSELSTYLDSVDETLPHNESSAGSAPQSNTSATGGHEQTSTTGIALPVTELEDVRKQDIVRIHKSNLFIEMINLFKTGEMDFSKCRVIRVNANGHDERGTGEGFLKDVFCEFWELFYMKCCEGADIKVPILRHDMQQEEWTAIAYILVNGFKTVNYFPVQICKACFEDALFGVPYANLVDAFFRFVPKTDRVALEKAFNHFQDSDLGDLIDVLETYDCKKYPSQDNIKNIIQEIAHKEIIQQPKFVTDCWKSVFQTRLHWNQETLSKMYLEMCPTVNKILKSLTFPESLDLKGQVTAGYLKKFVKGLDDKDVHSFMRFCTGANLSCDIILVEFTKLSGLQRRPTAQTCGNILRLPTSYESAADLREDFLNIFERRVWDMDYV